MGRSLFLGEYVQLLVLLIYSLHRRHALLTYCVLASGKLSFSKSTAWYSYQLTFASLVRGDWLLCISAIGLESVYGTNNTLLVKQEIDIIIHTRLRIFIWRHFTFWNASHIYIGKLTYNTIQLLNQQRMCKSMHYVDTHYLPGEINRVQSSIVYLRSVLFCGN